MSIATQITALQTDKTNISNSITTMGGTVNSGDGFDNFASDILTIPSGGGTDYMAQRVQGTLSSYTIPNTCTKISTYAFAYQPLTSITFPSSVTSIDEYAFYQSGLTSVTIPSTIEYIFTYAFQYCSSLQSITFDSNSNIDISALVFSGCTNLKYLNNFSAKVFNYDIKGSMFNSTGLIGDISLGDHCTVRNNAFNNSYSSGMLNIHLTQDDISTSLLNSYTFGNYSFNSTHCRLVVPYSSDHSILTAYQTAFPTYSSIMIEETQ